MLAGGVRTGSGRVRFLKDELEVRAVEEPVAAREEQAASARDEADGRLELDSDLGA